MSRFFRICLTMALVTTLPLPGIARTAGAEKAESDLIITVRVYNQAQTPHAVLAQAEKEAKRIFREVSIETIWVECPLSSAEIQKFPDCQPDLDVPYFNLRIIPRFEASSAGFRDTHLGFALPAKEGGIYASIFYHRVEEIANGGHAEESQVLGHAMAHEMGHLLLGSKSHSPTGIMRAQWNGEDLKRASLGLLRFTPEQSKVMQADVSCRRKNETPRAPSTPSKQRKTAERACQVPCTCFTPTSSQLVFRDRE